MTAAPKPQQPDEGRALAVERMVRSAADFAAWSDEHRGTDQWTVPDAFIDGWNAGRRFAAPPACGHVPPPARTCCSSLRGQPHVAGECTSLAALAGDEPPALCRATNAGWMQIEDERFWVTDICGLPPHDADVMHRSPSGETWN